MEHISRGLEQIARNIEIVGGDPITQRGFTQVPNFILENPKLSVGAKMTYSMLLKYAWDKQGCFPGQDRLADDMGAGKRSVIRFLQELEREGFIVIERRGLGQTNYYKVIVVPQKPAKKGTRPSQSNGTA